MKLHKRHPRLITLAAATTFVFAPLAIGQTEYEPDEGYHEEEWYDPSDWFDVETGTVDYEEMDDEYDYDYETTDHDFVDEWDTYYDAYYDGYYDGYYDDEFGFDYWDPEWNSTFATGYSDGYYDGYYDNEQDYEYEPYYYITTYTIDRDDATRKQRNGDETRERGDRVKGEQAAQRQRGERGERQMERRRQERRPQRTDMARRRGTVESISSINPEGIRDNHHVLKINLKEGDTVRADFGPKMTRQRLPFSEGDRVTLRGNKMKKNGRTFLIVQKIRSGDKEIMLRPGDEGYTRSGERQRRAIERQNAGRLDQPRHHVMLRGTVSEVEQPDLDVNGRTLLRVRMEDGRARVLAFSDDVSRDDLDIQSGDRVRIDGRRMKLKGRKVVDVSSVRVNGERVRISRR